MRGLTEDLAELDVVLTEADVVALRPRPRFGVIAHTTQPVGRVGQLVGMIRKRFPAAVDLAQSCDAVVVIGGANSNNTRELAATCRRFCNRVYEVQHAVQVNHEWFRGVETLGITAGTSTPDSLIARVEARIGNLLALFAPGKTDDEAAP